MGARVQTRNTKAKSRITGDTRWTQEEYFGMVKYYPELFILEQQRKRVRPTKQLWELY